MAEGLHTYTATGRMRRATHAEVCRWAVKPSTIVNGFIKAKIIRGAEEEEREDQDQDAGDAEGLREELVALFCSDSEDSDFEGFDL